MQILVSSFLYFRDNEVPSKQAFSIKDFGRILTLFTKSLRTTESSLDSEF